MKLTSTSVIMNKLFHLQS